MSDGAAWQPVSPEEVEACAARRLPPPAEVRDGLWVLPLPNPGNYAGGTLCYAVRDTSGAVHLIDPGPAGPDAVAALETGLALMSASPEDVATVVVTHLHPDHQGLAEELRARSGARVLVSRVELEAAATAGSPERLQEQLERWGVPPEERAAFRPPVTRPIPVEGRLEDGDLLPIPGRDLRVVASPGHTAGHVVLVSDHERLVLLGDHVLPHLNPGIGAADGFAGNPVVEYLRALDRTGALEGYAALPGHGYRFGDLAGRCAAIARHHRRRNAEIAAIAAIGRTVWEVAGILRWRGGWSGLTPGMRRSALQQTESHLAALADDALRAELVPIG